MPRLRLIQGMDQHAVTRAPGLFGNPAGKLVAVTASVLLQDVEIDLGHAGWP